MTAHSRLCQAFESLPVHRTVTAVGVFAVVFLFKPYAVAQDYPPYGPNVPTAHFDHGNRGHAIPPPPKLKCPVLSPSCTDTRTAQSEWNTELLGSDTLDGRSTYQPLVVHQGDRYIAYMGHHAGSAINRLTGVPEANGTSILDVTDPQHPIYLHHIIGASGGGGDAGGNQMVRVCSGDSLPSNSPAEANRKHGHYYLLRSNGSVSHQVYDVTDPSNPILLNTIAPGLTATHKNYWECYTGLAYLVANDGPASILRTDGTGRLDSSAVPPWQTNQHIKIYNLHDPARSEYIRDFGLVGQEPTAQPLPGNLPLEGLVFPPPGIHGPIAAGNRIYAPYGVGSNGVVQILDSSKVLNGCTKLNASLHCATNPTQAEMLDPQLGWFTLPGTSLQGGHTSFPIFGEQNGKPRNLLLVSSEEGGNECVKGSAPHAAWLYDITDEANPKLIGEDPNDPARTKIDVPNGFDYTWVGIVPGNGLPDNHCGTANCPQSGVYGANVTPQDPPTPNNTPNNFCNQGARFGNHSSSELFYPPYYGRLAIMAWFTGGLRVFDIRNPDDPRPIAYFIPEPNDTGCGPQGGPSPGPGCTFANTGRDGHTVHAIHTNNAEVDARGLIYTADRAGTGMHIIQLTGEAAAASVGRGNDK